MENDRLSRKLAVILHADVVGSTALVQKDETLAHERIQSTFHNFSRTIKAYGGKAREIRGDALVAEFNRASDAVIAAVAFQAENEESNVAYVDDIRPQLRIGISLGEVIIADNTITGAGVVLAQRLEQLADPGGVVLQGSVTETVPDRLPFEFENLGEQTVKGFDQPVRAFIARLRPGEKLPDSEVYSSRQIEIHGEFKASGKLSIAVLPFTNMSSDPEQEFFSDGITEDIITELSKISVLMVIARNSTFVYKGKPVDIKQVGRDLDVVYVLEGSVRKSGNRVRVTAQLIDAVTGQHKWAERYDRDLEDIFLVQDEIMREVVLALDIQLLAGEQARFWSDGTKNLQAWEYFRQGRSLFNSYRIEDHPEIIRLARKALDFDPNYSAAWWLLAGVYFHIDDNTRYSDKERLQAKELSRQYLQKAGNCDSSSPFFYSQMAFRQLSSREFDEAIISTNKAVDLAPNHANIIASSAIVLNKCGQSEIAIERIQKAIYLCPVYPLWYLSGFGQISRLLGKTDGAIHAYKEMINRDLDSLEGHVGLAEILGETDQIETAKVAAAEVVRINPGFSIARYTGNLAYRDQNEVTRIAEGLRKAGLPE
jgi:adenylate cyclase